MSYIALRHLHITCALLSISLFALRGGLLLAGRPLPRVLRWLPHVNDTLLLAAAITMVVLSAQYPWQQGWLAAKILALLAYIGMGKFALAPGLPTQQRGQRLVLSLLVVAYILGVARTRTPWIFF